MNTWNHVPLIRLLPFFVSGIFLGYSSPANFVEAALGIPVLVLLACWAWRRRVQYRRRWIYGAVACLLMMECGRILTLLHAEDRRPAHFFNAGEGTYICIAMSSPVEKPRSIKLVAEVRAIRTGGTWRPASRKLLVYLAKTKKGTSLRFGDVITFHEAIVAVPGPVNPGQFDYKSWLRYQEIYHQVYLPDSSWTRAGTGEGNVLVEKAGLFRDRLMAVFSRSGIAGQEYAVLSALLLGDDDEIKPDLYRAYAASGALHILSVSGLHVGVIYLALNATLFFLRHRKVRWIRCSIFLVFLWSYALLTGASPSVLRSAAMLSFVVAGKAMSRRTSMLNTLSASAFVLLSIDPGMLMQAGFQLSYLAVTGIILVYPPLHTLVYSRYRLLRAGWSMVAVSLAAQIATFPLGLYYFHQFPNYFLPANLLVIPLSSLVIYGGILLYTVSPFPAVSTFTGHALSWLLWLLNKTVLFIQSLPHALSGGIVLDGLELLLIFLCVIAFILVLSSRHRFALIAFVSCAACFMACRIYDQIACMHRKQFVVFDFPGRSVLDFTDGTNGFALGGNAFAAELSLQMRNYWWQTGAESHRFLEPGRTSSATWESRRPWLRFYGKTLLVADSTFVAPKQGCYRVDFLVVSGNLNGSMNSMLNTIEPGLIILDASHSVRKAKQRVLELGGGVPVYSVPDSGAFVYTLEK